LGVCESVCAAVHNSSFGNLFGIPIGFFAAAFFALLIGCHWRGRWEMVSTGIGLMAGAETYLTFIQFTHLDSVCVWCLGFYGLVLLGFILMLTRDTAKPVFVVSAIAFFTAHFVFFPPGADIKASLVKTGDRPQIEIFASPSCEHCEKAIANLESLCSGTNTDLVLRPVGLSKKDRKFSTEWVCNTIFDKYNATSRRLAEKIVWKNEREARALNDGSLAVPIIVVKNEDGAVQTFKGWDPTVKTAIEKSVGGFHNISLITGVSANNAFSMLSSSDNAAEGVCGNAIESTCGEQIN